MLKKKASSYRIEAHGYENNDRIHGGSSSQKDLETNPRKPPIASSSREPNVDGSVSRLGDSSSAQEEEIDDAVGGRQFRLCLCVS